MSDEARPGNTAAVSGPTSVRPEHSGRGRAHSDSFSDKSHGSDAAVSRYKALDAAAAACWAADDVAGAAAKWATAAEAARANGPGHAGFEVRALRNVGVCLHRLGRRDDAAAVYERMQRVSASMQTPQSDARPAEPRTGGRDAVRGQGKAMDGTDHKVDASLARAGSGGAPGSASSATSSVVDTGAWDHASVSSSAGIANAAAAEKEVSRRHAERRRRDPAARSQPRKAVRRQHTAPPRRRPRAEERAKAPRSTASMADEKRASKSAAELPPLHALLEDHQVVEAVSPAAAPRRDLWSPRAKPASRLRPRARRAQLKAAASASRRQNRVVPTRSHSSAALWKEAASIPSEEPRRREDRGKPERPPRRSESAKRRPTQSGSERARSAADDTHGHARVPKTTARGRSTPSDPAMDELREAALRAFELAQRQRRSKSPRRTEVESDHSNDARRYDEAATRDLFKLQSPVYADPTRRAADAEASSLVEMIEDEAESMQQQLELIQSHLRVDEHARDEDGSGKYRRNSDASSPTSARASPQSVDDSVAEQHTRTAPTRRAVSPDDVDALTEELFASSSTTKEALLSLVGQSPAVARALELALHVQGLGSGLAEFAPPFPSGIRSADGTATVAQRSSSPSSVASSWADQARKLQDVSDDSGVSPSRQEPVRSESKTSGVATAESALPTAQESSRVPPPRSGEFLQRPTGSDGGTAAGSIDGHGGSGGAGEMGPVSGGPANSGAPSTTAAEEVARRGRSRPHTRGGAGELPGMRAPGYDASSPSDTAQLPSTQRVVAALEELGLRVPDSVVKGDAGSAGSATDDSRKSSEVLPIGQDEHGGDESPRSGGVTSPSARPPSSPASNYSLPLSPASRLSRKDSQRVSAALISLGEAPGLESVAIDSDEDDDDSEDGAAESEAGDVLTALSPEFGLVATGASLEDIALQPGADDVDEAVDLADDVVGRVVASLSTKLDESLEELRSQSKAAVMEAMQHEGMPQAEVVASISERLDRIEEVAKAARPAAAAAGGSDDGVASRLERIEEAVQAAAAAAAAAKEAVVASSPSKSLGPGDEVTSTLLQELRSGLEAVEAAVKSSPPAAEAPRSANPPDSPAVKELSAKVSHIEELLRLFAERGAAPPAPATSDASADEKQGVVDALEREMGQQRELLETAHAASRKRDEHTLQQLAEKVSHLDKLIASQSASSGAVLSRLDELSARVASAVKDAGNEEAATREQIAMSAVEKAQAVLAAAEAAAESAAERDVESQRSFEKLSSLLDKLEERAAAASSESREAGSSRAVDKDSSARVTEGGDAPAAVDGAAAGKGGAGTEVMLEKLMEQVGALSAKVEHIQSGQQAATAIPKSPPPVPGTWSGGRNRSTSAPPPPLTVGAGSSHAGQHGATTSLRIASRMHKLAKDAKKSGSGTHRHVLPDRVEAPKPGRRSKNSSGILKRFEQERHASILRRSKRFTGLSEAELLAVIEHSDTVHFNDGEYLCKEGDLPGEMFVIVQGGVSAVLGASTGGTPRVLLTRGVGEIIGEFSLFARQRRTCDLVARGNTICLALGQAQVKTLEDEHAEDTLHDLLASLAKRGKAASEAISSHDRFGTLLLSATAAARAKAAFRGLLERSRSRIASRRASEETHTRREIRRVSETGSVP